MHRQSAQPIVAHATSVLSCGARGICKGSDPSRIDGEHGDHVLLAPPFIATLAELDLIVERIEAGTEPAERAA